MPSLDEVGDTIGRDELPEPVRNIVVLVESGKGIIACRHERIRAGDDPEYDCTTEDGTTNFKLSYRQESQTITISGTLDDGRPYEIELIGQYYLWANAEGFVITDVNGKNMLELFQD